jgi:hypothetical protein
VKLGSESTTIKQQVNRDIVAPKGNRACDASISGPLELVSWQPDETGHAGAFPARQLDATYQGVWNTETFAGCHNPESMMAVNSPEFKSRIWMI